jgi:hypothetical protein
LLLAHQHDPGFDKIADDLFDVAADIADLGELGRFHLDEGRAGELGQAARDLGLADAGRPDHQDVLRHHLVAQRAFSCWRRQRLRSAMATARLASFWPMMKRSSSETVSRGEKFRHGHSRLWEEVWSNIDVGSVDPTIKRRIRCQPAPNKMITRADYEQDQREGRDTGGVGRPLTR